MDILLPLSPPLVLCAAWIAGGCHSWWRRRRRAAGHLPADVYPGSVEHTVDLLRARKVALQDAVELGIIRRAELKDQRPVEDPVAVAERTVFEEFLRASKRP